MKQLTDVATRLIERRNGPLLVAVKALRNGADLDHQDAWNDRVLDAMIRDAMFGGMKQANSIEGVDCGRSYM